MTRTARARTTKTKAIRTHEDTHMKTPEKNPKPMKPGSGSGAGRRVVAQDPVALVTESDIVPDGDYAGFSANEVLAAVTGDIHEALGPVTIEFAGAALDRVLGEFLGVVQCADGDSKAKECALRFCETALPYATLPVPVGETYATLRRIKKA